MPATTPLSIDTPLPGLLRTRIPDFAEACRTLAAKLAAGDMPVPAFREALCTLLMTQFGVSRASVWRFAGDGETRRMRCVGLSTVRDGFDPGGAELHATEFSIYFSQLLTRGVFIANDVALEPSLAGLAPYFARTGVRSLLDTSFQINGRPFGVVCLEETDVQRTWTSAEAASLRQAASVISLMIARLGPTFDFGMMAAAD
jgi:GAF domain-containing protein